MTLLPAHREFLIEHLPYELEMLEWSYAALHEDRLSKFREHNLIGNLAVESFWVHVRNLIDFFNQPCNGSETGSASASDFIKSQRFDANLSRKTLKDEI